MELVHFTSDDFIQAIYFVDALYKISPNHRKGKTNCKVGAFRSHKRGKIQLKDYITDVDSCIFLSGYKNDKLVVGGLYIHSTQYYKGKLYIITQEGAMSLKELEKYFDEIFLFEVEKWANANWRMPAGNRYKRFTRLINEHKALMAV